MRRKTACTVSFSASAFWVGRCHNPRHVTVGFFVLPGWRHFVGHPTTGQPLTCSVPAALAHSILRQPLAKEKLPCKSINLLARPPPTYLDYSRGATPRGASITNVIQVNDSCTNLLANASHDPCPHRSSRTFVQTYIPPVPVWSNFHDRLRSP